MSTESITSGQFSSAMNAKIRQRESDDLRLIAAAQSIVRAVLSSDLATLPAPVREARSQMVILAAQIVDPAAAALNGDRK